MIKKQYEKGLVSVIIPTYKRSAMLTRAIDSVLHQTHEKLEVIVVNDNDPADVYSDELNAQMSRYVLDKRVSLIGQKKHINGAVARNVGISVAKGEYLAFLDDDDWWEPQKIEHQKELLDKLGFEYGAVSCLMRHYKNDKLVYVSLPYKENDLMFKVITRQGGIGTGSPLFRREAIDVAGYFDEKLIRHQDIQFFAMFCSKFKIKLLNEYLYNYDLGDAQNRPSPERIIDIKNNFYASIDEILKSLSQRRKIIVKAYNDFEIGIAFFKAKNIKMGMRYIKSIFFHPIVTCNCLNRALTRWKGRAFAAKYEKKYGVEKNGTHAV